MTDVTEIKLNDTVRIIRSIDDSNPAQRIGEIGKVTQVNVEVNPEMITVQFSDGYDDGYWPEEVEVKNH